MIYGVDYYPEHWPVERWPVDAKLMKEAGINTVRLGEFAWTQMEPTDGEYDFGWLDQAIEILAAEGIKAVLCTPSATPPKWLLDELVDPYLVDEFGHVRAYGTRRHVCATCDGLKAASRRIAREMARHYRDNPNVIAWQIDNEFGCHVTIRCYCERCRKKFIDWLMLKYGSLEAVNQAWGTVFWNETFTAWDQIILPGYGALWYDDSTHGHNPGMLLDFYRYSSDNWVVFQNEQVREIRKIDKRPITTNFMGNYSELNSFDLAGQLDFVTWDNYPDFTITNKESWHVPSMAHDTVRGLKNKNFWIMEEQSGPCGKSVFAPTPYPGHIRLWSWQAVAHGADAILYFRWRACRFGAEQYWHGVLGHDGVPGRRYKEVRQAGEEMQKAADRLEGARVVSRIGMVKNFDNQWSSTFHLHAPGLNYYLMMDQYYKALTYGRYTMDIVSIQADLNKYALLILPMFNVVTEEQAALVEDYVRQGGTLVLTFRSGTRNEDNAMRDETIPGPFAKLCGITVHDWDALGEARTVKVVSNGSSPVSFTGTAKLWADIITVDGAQPIATYDEGWYAGETAMAVHSYGAGKVYYIGCAMDDESLVDLIGSIAAQAGVKPTIKHADEKVEAVWRDKNGMNTLVVMNHDMDKPAHAVVEYAMTDLLTGETFQEEVTLPPLGVRVLVKAG